MFNWPLPSKKSSPQPDKLYYPSFWEQKWQLVPIKPPEGIEMTLSITPERIYLNQKLLDGKTAMSTEEKWVYYDHFGYKLILQRSLNDAVTFFDEADNKLYRAERID